MLDSPEYERWLGSARAALDAADGQRRLGYHNWACFQAEQAAQLAVKGLLHGAGAGAAAWGHDLPTLVERALDVDDALGDLRPAATRLSLLYVATRYPDALPGLSPESRFGPTESEQAIADAHGVLDAVSETWARLAAAGEGAS